MKKIITLVIIFVVFSAPGTVFAQTDNQPDQTIVATSTFGADESGPAPATLTASGSKFANGSADGQCTVADAPCTMPNGKGICLDNGQGAGVCTVVNPTIDPLFDTGCSPDDICHIPPEKVGRKNDVGQSKTKEWGQRDPTGSLWEFVQNWIGEVKPKAIYHYGTPILTAFGFQVFDAFTKDLAPAAIQKITLYDVQPKPYCMTSRLCVYDPVDHHLVGNYLTHETWCTDDPPARKELIMGSRLAAAAMTSYKVGPDLRLPYTAVKKIAALPCGAKLEEGRSMDLENLPFIKQNLYGDDTITHFAITVQADMVSIIQKFIEKLQKFVDIFVSTEHTPAIEVGSAENGMSASLGGISFTVTMKDLKPFAYPSDQGKQALTQSGGLWNSYRTTDQDIAFKTLTDARFETQDWYYGMAGEGDIQSPTLQSMNARQENAQLAGNCNMRNADDPVWKILGCDKINWAPEPSETAGGWNCNGGSPTGQSTSDGGQDYANRVYGSCPNGSDNAWAKCKNDVVSRAQKACVDPTFTLAIWLHESGASNYKCGNQLTGAKIEDFGIHNSPNAPPEDFSKQLDAFLRLPDAYAAKCPGKTMQDFVAMYWIGNGCYSSLSSADKSKIDGYIGELNDIYASIAPGKSLPSWPKGSCSGSSR